MLFYIQFKRIAAVSKTAAVSLNGRSLALNRPNSYNLLPFHFLCLRFGFPGLGNRILN